MADQISRYRTLPEVVTFDAQGRKHTTQALRTGVTATGEFEHTLQAGDRLDHLASRYYQEPRKWWRICDANPEFLSPLALLGSEPVVTERVPLVVADPETVPRFNDLLRQLRAVSGVESVQLEDVTQLVPEKRTVAGKEITVQVEHFTWTLVITCHQQTLREELIRHIEAAGITPARPEPVSRVGKRIVIPPNGNR